MLSVLKQKVINANVGTGPQGLNVMINNQGQPSLTLGGKAYFYVMNTLSRVINLYMIGVLFYHKII